MCFSTDMSKKFVYQKEVEYMKLLPPEERNETVLEYMTKELERIKRDYGDEPTRD